MNLRKMEQEISLKKQQEYHVPQQTSYLYFFIVRNKERVFIRIFTNEVMKEIAQVAETKKSAKSFFLEKNKKTKTLIKKEAFNKIRNAKKKFLI